MPTLLSVTLSLFCIFVVHLWLRLRRVTRNLRSVCFRPLNDQLINPRPFPQQPLRPILPLPPYLSPRFLTRAHDPTDSLYTPWVVVDAPQEL